MKPMYGVGYEPLGDLYDFLDPLGIHKVAGKVVQKVAQKATQKVDQWVDGRAEKAAVMAEQHVEAGVRRAVGDASKTALLVGGGVLLVGAVAGGVFYFTRPKHDAGHRR